MFVKWKFNCTNDLNNCIYINYFYNEMIETKIINLIFKKFK